MTMTNKLSTLWIGDLEPYMDETFLKHAFTLMGESLLNAKVIRNRYTGAIMGYGFLDFGDEATSLRVLHMCNGKIIPNANPPKRFKLNHATYGKENPAVKEFSLFVGDLSEDVDDLALFMAFSGRFNSVKAAKVVLDQNGSSKGYGFVRFFEESEYNSALIEIQSTMFVGSKPIRVSIATPKSKQTLGQPAQPASPPAISPAALGLNTGSSSQTPTSAYYQYPAGYDYQAYCQAYYQQQQQQYYGAYPGYDPNNYAAASYEYAQQMQQNMTYRWT